MMEALTAFDAIAIVIVIVSTLMALARGFIRELATLGAFIAAMAAAYFANKFLNKPLSNIIPGGLPDWTPEAILLIGTFLVIYIVVAIFGAKLSKSIQGVDGIGLVDRLAGGIFGFARGGIVLVFFAYILNLAMDQDKIPEFISKARTYPIINSGAVYLKENAPALAERTKTQLPLDAETPDE